MRRGTAWPRRIAEDVTRSWRYGGPRGRLGVSSLALCTVLLCVAAASVAVTPAAGVTTAPTVRTGLPVPPGQLPVIKNAATSCPELTPPRLAAQLMAASGFNPDFRAPGGIIGVAGLTLAQWRQWIPAPGTPRTDVASNILALAHDDCDQAGQVRAAGVPGNLWHLALAAFKVGLPAVIAAHGIPAGAAGYVNTVAAYGAFYVKQPQFDGQGAPTPTPAPTSHPASPAASPSATAGTTSRAVNPAGGWRLAWSDEFNGTAGSAPDGTKWTPATGGGGFGNSELEYYTNGTANAGLDGQGNLAITARNDAASGLSCWYGACGYTSARLDSLGHFSVQYGQISARIKLPSGQGLWPTFEMLGTNSSSVAQWQQAGLIDILSDSNSTSGTVYSGLTGPDNYNRWWIDTCASCGSFAGSFHTFTVDWYPDHISFLIDGHIYFTQYRALSGAGWVFDHPFYLILDLAVGGTQPGSPDATTTFPAQMLVDWVRVYTAGPPTASATGQITGMAGRCAEASSSGAIQLDACNGGAGQTWTAGTDGTIRAEGKCLSVPGSANGTSAQLSACSGTGAQMWQAETNGQLLNPSSGRCLSVTGGSSANLTPLQLFDCSGAADQLWKLP
jgi:beta-glucanase (GH16 family)